MRVLERRLAIRAEDLSRFQPPVSRVREAMVSVSVPPRGEGRRSGNVSSCLTLGGAQRTSHPARQPAPVKRTGRAFRPASLEP